MSFEELNLIAPLLRAIADEGYVVPTPIQQQAIPQVLEGRDLLGCAQTGTGKTAAFALPILQRLSAAPRVKGRAPIRTLILTPTRELAAQIGESFATYGRGLHLSHTVVFGGVGQNPQVAALRRGVDILIATPGRLLDLASQREVDLSRLEVFVLDEADRMLDMGFLPDVRRVLAMLPSRRQTLLFSATMPADIAELASRILVDPVRVAVTPVASTVELIDQSVFYVAKPDKRALLEHVLGRPETDRVLVFTRTKHGANKVVKDLERARIHAEAIHGNKSQNARTRALAQFKDGTTRVLVATDIAARGIDIEGISHVVNYDLPEVPESYVHRIGRTARAGAAGIAWSFCSTEERVLLRDIERLIRMRLEVQQDGGPVQLQAEGPREAPRNSSRQGVPPANRQAPPLPSGGRRRSWGPSGRRSGRPAHAMSR
ncbi:MAG TPA: DEAD/DEAH box helicase [Polyangiaceae bacterium]|nr:DEAD/DEAH box helicase [Polyangiaceae bacterium]